jgi:hypothetical protein
MKLIDNHVLSAIAIILNLGSFTSTSVDLGQYNIGIMVVAAASWLSGISGAFVQKAFIGPKPRNPLLLSAELAVYGIAFLVLRDVFTTGSSSSINPHSVFANWDLYTCIPILTSVRFS